MFIDNLNNFIPEKPKKVNEDKTFWIDNQVKQARNKNRLISFFNKKMGLQKLEISMNCKKNWSKIDSKKIKDFYQNKLQTQAAENKQDFFSSID